MNNDKVNPVSKSDINLTNFSGKKQPEYEDKIKNKDDSFKNIFDQELIKLRNKK